MKLRGWKVVVAVPLLCSVNALGDDGEATDRERQLERRVEELERQLAGVNRRLAESAADRSGDELASRVSELERLARKDENGLFPYWKSGAFLESADKGFKLKFGGIVQNDWSWFPHAHDVEAGLRERIFDGLVAGGKGRPAAMDEASAKSQIETGTEFRRARLHVTGTIYRNVDFMAEYDFAGGAVGFRHVWMGTRIPCVGRLQVGSMKEPYGLEEMTPDPFVTFLERSTATEAFSPAFNTGFLLSDTCAEERVTWAAGLFRDAAGNGNDTGNARSGEWNFTGRVTGRPWIGDTPDRYLHVGGAASLRDPSDGVAAYASRPELHLVPALVDTGALATDGARLYEAEAAFVSGPWSAAAEYHRADVSGRAGSPDSTFHAFAVQGSWFLTGESRPYSTQRGAFDRIAPKHAWGDESGSGAWELALRWDTLDLEDGAADGGRMQVRTLGVNWYLNPNTKVAFGWVHARTAGLGELDGVEMRFQIDF